MANKLPAKITVTPNNSWVQQAKWLAVAVALVILFLGWLLLIRPLINSLADIRNPVDIEAAQQEVLSDIDSISSLKREYQQVAVGQRDRFNLAMPQGRDIPTLLAQLEGVAKQSGVLIQGIDFIGSGDENNAVKQPAGSTAAGQLGLPFKVNTLQINVTLGTGSYQQLKSFIAAVEQSIRLIDLTSITFSRDSKGTESGYVLNFKTLYLP